MNKFTHDDWNLRQGTVPVTWSEQDYLEMPWRALPPLPDGRANTGFTTWARSYEIYGDRISAWTPEWQQAGEGVRVPDEVAARFDPVLDLFHLDSMIYTFGRYTPGQVLPWHTDNYPTYMRRHGVRYVRNIVRVIVLLHDSEPGQQLWVGDQLRQGPAGSWFSWQGRQRHMAANLSESDRYMMQITGVLPPQDS